MFTNFLFTYSFRIVKREWRKYALPFISLTFTSAIVFLILLLSSSTKEFLISKNQEIVGGDVSFESSYYIEKEKYLEKVEELRFYTDFTENTTFNAVISNKKGSASPVFVEVVDKNYPLYGNISLKENKEYVSDKNFIYIDKNASEKLSASPGEVLTFGDAEYYIAGIIDKEPSSIIGGFRFLPKVIISQEGFARAGIERSLLRAEYETKFKIATLAQAENEAIISKSKDLGVRVDIASESQGGFIQGLSLLSQFLILSVLLVCVLAVVNIYTGVVYFIDVLKKSLAILLSTGLSKKNLIITISLSFLYVTILSSAVGIAAGYVLFHFVTSLLASSFDLFITESNLVQIVFITFFTTIFITIASFVPGVKNVLTLSPKDLITGTNTYSENNTKTIKNILPIITLTLVPIAVIAMYLLENIFWGAVVISSLFIVYIFLASLFYFFFRALYTRRNSFSFEIKTIIAQKYSDGILGIVSLTSLFVGFSILSVMILLQATLADFLNQDLKRTVPSVYVIDIQESQKEKFLDKYQDFNLFPNIGARIVSIDDRNIAEEMQKAEGRDRELGREYNVTFRDSLLDSEKIVTGEKSIGKKGYVSVDKDFADRAGISIGSRVVLSVQGFEVPVVVNNFRKTDNRSGLPFFYMVLSNEDMERFPKTFFGYANYDNEKIKSITKYLSENIPNASLINTSEISGIANQLIKGLLVLVFAVSLPPLVLSLFLILTLILSLFNSRKRDAVQLLALGSTKSFVRTLYLKESVSGTLFIAMLSYVLGVLIVFLISRFYLKINHFTFFDQELVYGLFAIIGAVFILAYFLWYSDKKSIKELLLEK